MDLLHIIIIALIVYLSTSDSFVVLITSEDSPTQKPFPSIWGGKQDGRGEASENRYRILAELYLFGSNKTFMLEEWASGIEETFRLDIVEYPQDKRSTILYKQKTSELFEYTPFRCNLLTNIEEALGPSLAGVFPTAASSNSKGLSFIPTGLGALWLHASRMQPNCTRAAKAVSGGSKQDILSGYDIYSIESSENYSWAANFYAFSSIDGPESMASIELGPILVAGKPIATMAHIKLLEIESPPEEMSQQQQQQDIFDLPVGYGCKRDEKFEHTFPVTSFPNNNNWHQPELLQLQLVSLHPINHLHDVERWRAHSSSMKIITGQLSHLSNGNNLYRKYIIVETNDYNNNYGGKTAKFRSTSLRRLKRVGVFEGIEKGEEVVNPNHSIGRSTSINFELDERTGECLGYSENVYAGDDDHDDDHNINVEISKNSANDEPFDALVLNTSFIKSILLNLTANSDYHLLKEDTGDPMMKNYFYERRESKFEMRDNRGTTLWSGPVSIVLNYKSTSRAERKSSRDDYRLSMKLIFLSQDLSRILAKIQINLIEYKLISKANFHRKLDVSPCYASLLISSRPDDEIKRSNLFESRNSDSMIDGLNIELNYPIEDKEIVERLSNSDYSDSIVYEKFLESILTATGGHLDPLQLTNIQIDYGLDVMRISATLIDRPNLLDFRQISRQDFAKAKSELLFKELKSNEESCAESCNHYECHRFSYCSSTNQCNILLMNHEEDSSAIKFEPSAECNLFVLRRDHRRLSSFQLVEKLRKLIEGGEKVEELSLNIDYFNSFGSSKNVSLVPISIKSNHELEQDFLDLESEIDTSQDSVPLEVSKRNELINVDGKSKRSVSPEYQLVFSNKKFKSISEVNDKFPIKQANLISSYEDCQELCEELDCKSFSYCKMEQTCLVSQLHRTNEIGSYYLEEEEFCFIMARDYLSKFQKFTQFLKPTNEQVEKSLSISGQRDCAIECMEENEFKCRSFYYCQQESLKKKEVNCFLYKNHLSIKRSFKQQHNDDDSNSEDLKGEQQQASNKNCSLYMRSYLSEFDKYYQKSLPANYDDSTILIKGLNAEVCAIECAEKRNNALGNCRAFQVCRNEALHEPTCALLTTNVDLPQRTIINGLIERRNCTTFVVSKGSELNVVLLSSSNDTRIKNDLTLILDDESKSERTHHLLGIMILLIIGFTLGFALSVLIVNKRIRT